MRKLLVLIAFTAVVLGLAPTAEAALTRQEKWLLYRVNQARVSHGVKPLRIGWTLQQDAHRRADYLRQNSLFFHPKLPAGVGENIGWMTCRRHPARIMVRWWLDSPAHREHLLSPDFTRIGVGVSRGSYKGYPCAYVDVARFR